MLENIDTMEKQKRKQQEFEQVIRTLEEGLKSLWGKRDRSIHYGEREKLGHEIKTQEAKIQFFRKGYDFRVREEGEQKNLFEDNLE